MKTVTHDITFAGHTVPYGFRTDGCTLSPDTFFGVKLADACAMHDYLRRYHIVKTKKADDIFKAHLRHLGAPAWLAFIYYYFVRITSPLTRGTYRSSP